MSTRLLLYASTISVLALLTAFLRLSHLDRMCLLLPLLAMLVLLACLFALVFDPQGLLYVLMAIFPLTDFPLFRFEIGVITFSPFSAGIMCLGVYGLFLVAMGKARLKLEGCDVAILLLCLHYLASTLLSNDIMRSGFLAFHALFIPVMIYLALRIHARTSEELDNCLLFLCIGATLFSVFGVIQALSGIQRSQLLNIHPITQAALTYIPIVYLGFTGRARHPLVLLATAICAVSFMASLSRVFIACLLVSPLFYWLIRKGFARHLMLGLIAISLFLTLHFSFKIPGKTIQEIREYGNILDVHKELAKFEKGPGRLVNFQHWAASMEMRFLAYRIGLEEFLDHPIMGTGLKPGDVMITQHNFHVEWLEYGGVIGYVLYASIFMCFFWQAGGAAMHDNATAIFALVIFVDLFNCLFNGIMHGFLPYIVFMILAFTRIRLETMPAVAGAPSEGARP